MGEWETTNGVVKKCSDGPFLFHFNFLSLWCQSNCSFRLYYFLFVFSYSLLLFYLIGFIIVFNSFSLCLLSLFRHCYFTNYSILVFLFNGATNKLTTLFRFAFENCAFVFNSNIYTCVCMKLSKSRNHDMHLCTN